jgi:7-keto-8-aminopelargonate synthetase-like enzyme
VGSPGGVPALAAQLGAKDVPLDVEPLDPPDGPSRSRLRLIDAAFSAAIARGLAHLTAEDEQLGGRFLTLGGRRQVNFGSCSYLGLETDLRLKREAIAAVERYGVQFSSSRAYVSCPPYRELEALLGEIFEVPVFVAQTTTLAHFAALPIVVGPRDAVICDQLVHTSVQSVLPTLAAGGASCRLVRHNRMDRLDALVGALARTHARVWYLCDGIYSMHGDVAPLPELRALLARHDRLHLYVDDAHGMTWTGRHGRGFVLGDGAPPPRTVVVTSLAKGFAAGGAALVFPDPEMARVVRTCGTSLIFSGPLQPALLGAGIASARIHLSDELARRQRLLLERIDLFGKLTEARGVPLGSADRTPIRFVAVGDDDKTYRLAAELMDDGFYTNTAVFPAVSQGRGGLRIALTLHQTPDDIRALVDGIARRL